MGGSALLKRTSQIFKMKKKGFLPGLNSVLFVLLTIVVCFLLVFYALSRLGMADSPFGSGGGDGCEKPDGDPDMESVGVRAYADLSDAGLGKERKTQHTASVADDSTLGLETGQRIYVELGEDSPFNGCYVVEEEREGLLSWQLGVYAGRGEDDAEDAMDAMGPSPRADVWVIGKA
jgi:hypothetical protein